MYSIALLTVSFAILSNASPQVPSQGKGGKGIGAPKGGLPKGGFPKGGLGGLFGGAGKGQDLSGFAEALKNPSMPKMLGALGIPGLEDLWKVPDIQKYAPKYLDFRNISNVPFVAAMKMGPAPTGCSKYEILIARGTGELGDFGFIVGDPLLKRVRQALPEVRGYAVQYPANMDANSARTGAADVISRLQKQHKACPTQKFAVVGYSQGSMVMRSALTDAKKVGESAFKQIVAGAMFGGPRPGQRVGGPGGKGKTSGSPKGEAPPGAAPKGGAPSGPFGVAGSSKFDMGLEEKVRWNCAKGDFACGGNNVLMHLTYNNPDTNFMSESAAWIVAGFKGEPVPPKGSSVP